jgi:thioesterase domain-containing protein
MDTGVAKPEAAGEVVARELMRLPVSFSPPRDALEQSICGAFSRVLRVEPVGRDDEFYDLGGDSLAGEALSIEIEAATGHVFPISSLFRHATPAAVAQLLAGKVEQSTDQNRFFIVHGRGGYTSLTPEFRAGLKADRNVTMFELPGIRGDREPIWDIRVLAQAYVDQINKEQPQGPLRLAAFCAGSFIALEMASLLREAGRPLDRLVLIDPQAPPELKARHEAEMQLEREPGSMTNEEYFRRTGRWRDAAKDAQSLPASQQRMAKGHLAAMADNKVAFVNKHKGQGFADWPRAILMTMYRYAWPEPFTGRTYVIASEQRIGELMDPGSIWRRLTPNLGAAVVTQMHREIGRGEVGTRTAAMLEEAMNATT